MEVTFDTKKLQKICNSANLLRATYGSRQAALIQQRLEDMRGVANLEVMRWPFPGRCHELKQNLKGCLALDLVHPDRLAFKPNHNPRPNKENGGLDWSQVTRVIVVAIGNYH